jgi:hypothetical protein
MVAQKVAPSMWSDLTACHQHPNGTAGTLGVSAVFFLRGSA